MSLPRITKRVQAERDLDEIWLHIALDNVGAADALLDAIGDRCRLLAGQPMMGRARSELAPEVRSFVVGRYVIFYVPLTDGIEVVRVLHSSRDIAEFFNDG
ncbi:MAG: type II toxin-antitoxin system RelE/ParE family toxin [Burkholderiaceae bacterium]|nr:type II toxin-antitoxin system RelE/ParE family toxin [Burkholderiaceae bacterium]